MSYYGPGLGNGEQSEAASRSRDGGTIEQAVDFVKNVSGFPQREQAQAPAPMPGKTDSGAPSAGGFAQYAAAVAERETAAIDEEQAPFEEVPGDSEQAYQQDERSWVERYQSHITIGSTIIGLLTFVAWLVLRKKD